MEHTEAAPMKEILKIVPMEETEAEPVEKALKINFTDPEKLCLVHTNPDDVIEQKHIFSIKRTKDQLTKDLLLHSVRQKPCEHELEVHKDYFKFLAAIDDTTDDNHIEIPSMAALEARGRFNNLKNRRRYCIIIDGPIGAGKSTFLHILKDIFQDDISIAPERETTWVEEGILKEMYKNPEQRRDPFQRRAIDDAYLQTEAAVFPYKDGKPYTPYIVAIERGVMSQFILWPQLYPHLNKFTQEKYRDILYRHANIFTLNADGRYKDDWHFDGLFLMTEPEICQSSISQRGRDGEGEDSISLQYLYNMHRALQKYYDIYKNHPSETVFRNLEMIERNEDGSYFYRFRHAWKFIETYSDAILEQEGCDVLTFWNIEYVHPTTFNIDHLWKRLHHFIGARTLCGKGDEYYPTLLMQQNFSHLFFLPKLYTGSGSSPGEPSFPLNSAPRPDSEEKVCIIQFTEKVLKELIGWDNGVDLIKFLMDALMSPHGRGHLYDTHYTARDVLEIFLNLPSLCPITGEKQTLKKTGNYFSISPSRARHFLEKNAFPSEFVEEEMPNGSFVYISTEYTTPLPAKENIEIKSLDNDLATFMKLSPFAKLPKRATTLSAGLDLFSAREETIEPGTRKLILTDLAPMEFPSKCYARIAPRSGLALKYGIDIGAGVVDPDYRGNMGIIVINNSSEPFHVRIGDRIAQMIYEKIEFPMVMEVFSDDTTTMKALTSVKTRGANGFGSTGISD